MAGLALAGLVGGVPAPFWVVGLAALGMAPLLGSRTGGLLVVLGFAALGVARGAPVSEGPTAPTGPERRLWQVELLRSPGEAGGPVPVCLLSAASAPGAEPSWTGRQNASLYLGRWRVGSRGDLWLVRGRLRSPVRAGPPILQAGGPRSATRLTRSDRALDRLGDRADRSLHHLQRRTRRVIDRYAPGAQRGLLLALALGDRREVDPDLREAFSRTGTAHLLAISGLHVGCLAGILLVLARPALRRLPLRLDALQAGLPDRLAWLVAVAGAGLYVVVAGMPVSGRRALLMLTCVASGALLDRRTSAWNGLAGAAMLVAWFDPEAVRSAGFQLSVASVAGLLALAGPGRGGAARHRLLRPLTRAVVSSAAATLATAPLCAGIFGRVPVAGLWVNVVAIPILGLGTVPALLLGSALGAVRPELGAAPIWVAGWVAGQGCRLVEWCAEPARCPVITWEPAPLVVPATYLLAALVLAAGGRGARAPSEAP